MASIFNTSTSRSLQVVLGGFTFSVAQDPSPQTETTGRVVWEASLLLARYLERERIGAKRVIELGAGCSGLPGMLCALRGSEDVVLTDQAPVLDLLRKNVRQLDGDVQRHVFVREYSWGTPPADAELEPPYDLIIAADVIYTRESIEPFVQSLRDLSGQSTRILVCNERRDELVASEFLSTLEQSFTVKRLPSTKLGSEYGHESVELFVVRPKRREVKKGMNIL